MEEISITKSDKMDIVILPEPPDDRQFYIQNTGHTVEVYSGETEFAGHLIEQGHRALFAQITRKWFQFWKPKQRWELMNYEKI